MADTPDRHWLTAAEIAEAALPDLPRTKRRVNALAERLGWQTAPGLSRRRKGRGGGREYHWSLLPARARARLVEDSMDRPTKPSKPGRSEAWAAFEALPQAARQKAQDRLEALQAVDALTGGALTKDMAVREVAKIAGVSPRTIWNWDELIRGVAEEDRLAYLAPAHRGAARNAPRTAVDPGFGAQLKSDYLRLAQPSFRACYDRACRWAEAEGIPTVPLHTARRWYRREVSRAVEVLCRKGVQALKRMYPAQIRDRSGLRALEAVNGDYHKFDVFVRMPTPDGERVIRPQMVAFQDVFSGKLLAWRLSHSANTQTVQLCMGDLIEEWGIPEHALLDNGREFASKLFTGGAKTRFRWKVREDDVPGLLTSLGCEIHWATPYSGQSKPIERAFRDLCDRVARHPAFEGAYTGNAVDAKPEDYGSRAVAFEDFLSVLNVEIAEHNAREDRRSDVAYGRSFDAVFAESYAQAPIRKATAEQRRLWMLGAEGVQVGRDGSIRFMRNAYFAEFLHAHIGDKVVARFDDAALHDGLHIYALSGEYLGHAPCQEKVGFFDVEGARQIKRARSAYTRAAREAARAHKDLTAAEVAANVLGAAPDPVTERPAARVLALPKAVARGPKPAPRTAEDAPHAPASITPMPRRARTSGGGDERERFRKALEFETRQARGEALTEDQARWLAAYQRHPEYQAQKEIRDAHQGGAG
jgi:hypothetical protein